MCMFLLLRLLRTSICIIIFSPKTIIIKNSIIFYFPSTISRMWQGTNECLMKAVSRERVCLPSNGWMTIVKHPLTNVNNKMLQICYNKCANNKSRKYLQLENFCEHSHWKINTKWKNTKKKKINAKTFPILMRVCFVCTEFECINDTHSISCIVIVQHNFRAFLCLLDSCPF